MAAVRVAPAVTLYDDAIDSLVELVLALKQSVDGRALTAPSRRSTDPSIRATELCN